MRKACLCSAYHGLDVGAVSSAGGTCLGGVERAGARTLAAGRPNPDEPEMIYQQLGEEDGGRLTITQQYSKSLLGRTGSPCGACGLLNADGQKTA